MWTLGFERFTRALWLLKCVRGARRPERRRHAIRSMVTAGTWWQNWWYSRGVVCMRQPGDRESQYKRDAVHAARTARMHVLRVRVRPCGRWLPAAAYQLAGGLACSCSPSGGKIPRLRPGVYRPRPGCLLPLATTTLRSSLGALLSDKRSKRSILTSRWHDMTLRHSSCFINDLLFSISLLYLQFVKNI